MLDFQIKTLTLLSSASILKLISAIRSKVALQTEIKSEMSRVMSEYQGVLSIRIYKALIFLKAL